VVKKLGLSKDVCLAEAEAKGVVIPAEHWVLRVAKRGRPKKVVEVSDTESDGSSVKPKKTSRAKKSETSEETSDLLAAIMSTGGVSDSESVKSKTSSRGRPRISEEEKSKRAEAKAEKAAKKADERAAIRAEKAAQKVADRAAKKAEKVAEKVAEKAAKDAAKAAKAAEKTSKAAEKAAEAKAARVLARSLKDAERLAKKEAADNVKALSRAAKKAVKDAEKAAKKAVKDAEKAAKKAVKDAEKATVVQFVKEAADIAAEFSGAAAPELAAAAAAAAEMSDAEMSDTEMSDELVTEGDSDEESVDVIKFEHDGVTYAKDTPGAASGIVYDLKGYKYGTWDGTKITPSIATVVPLTSDGEMSESESDDDIEY